MSSARETDRLIALGTEPEAGTVRGTVDLHTHSTCSDGSLTPTELVAAAAAGGLSAIALTDHDTVDGLAEAQAAAAGSTIELVPGLELSVGGETAVGSWPAVHLLGYFVDSSDARLVDMLREFALARRARIERVMARLAQLGFTIDLPVRAGDRGYGTVGRPHVAQALVAAGAVSSVREAFDLYLGRGRPAFVSRPAIDPGTAIAAIRDAGGVAVLAHPLFVGDIDAVVARLAPLGLGGIEAFYGDYDEPTQQRLAETAVRWNLVATGGSDYHGPDVLTDRALGRPPVPVEVLDQLRARASWPR